MKKQKVAVIGGGITGLVAGYRLLQKGHGVTIFEKNESLGGLLGGFKIEGSNLEKAYHHIFKTDLEVIALIKELGLTKKLKWYESKTALFYDNVIYPFAGAIDLLKFKPLNLIDKLRLGLVKIYLEREKNWKKFENVLAFEWMKKWCGENAYKVVWEPLLKGKFSDRYKDISMAWMWARIHTRANSSEKGKEYLGYMEGGFQMIIDELEKRIKKLGGEIKINTEVNSERLLRDYTRNDGIKTRNDEINTRNDVKGFDKIISSAPLDGIDYLGAVTMVFSSRQSLGKFYWHNINDINSPFLAFIQHTNLMGSEHYRGRNIYYMGTYLPQKHKYFTCKDSLIEKDFLGFLKKIFPEFNEKEIIEKYIFRFKYAQHIVTRNYREKIKHYKSNNKIIHANFAQIYPEDRGINYAVREGEKVAQYGPLFGGRRKFHTS